MAERRGARARLKAEIRDLRKGQNMTEKEIIATIPGLTSGTYNSIGKEDAGNYFPVEGLDEENVENLYQDLTRRVEHLAKLSFHNHDGTLSAYDIAFTIAALLRQKSLSLDALTKQLACTTYEFPISIAAIERRVEQEIRQLRQPRIVRKSVKEDGQAQKTPKDNAPNVSGREEPTTTETAQTEQEVAAQTQQEEKNTPSTLPFYARLISSFQRRKDILYAVASLEKTGFDTFTKEDIFLWFLSIKGFRPEELARMLETDCSIVEDRLNFAKTNLTREWGVFLTS